MRQFGYQEEWKKLLTPEVVSYLTQIHEFKGEQTLFIETKPDALLQLVEIAKIQSTEASNHLLFYSCTEIYISLRDLVPEGHTKYRIILLKRKIPTVINL